MTVPPRNRHCKLVWVLLFTLTDYVLHHTPSERCIHLFKTQTVVAPEGQRKKKEEEKKFSVSNALTQLLIAFYRHQNDDEIGFNSALNHKVVEDGLCCLRCLAPSGSCPISLHQTRQTESEKWRRPACANINPKFLASMPS